MSLGPEKIILILVVALIVFGPQRLPDIARQLGAAMRELRKMQDTVRDELEHVMHPDFSAANPFGSNQNGAIEDTDHAALPAGPASDMSVDMTIETSDDGSSAPADDNFTDENFADENFTDDGFAGPRSFS